MTSLVAPMSAWFGMARGELIEARLTESVIGAFYDTYNALRYGFREHVYSLAMERELLARGHRVGRELAIPIFYKGEELTSERLDFIVDDRVVVELKATSSLPPGAERQVLSYLRASRLEVGLLLHFGPVARFYRVACSNATKNLTPIRPLRGRSDHTDSADNTDQHDPQNQYNPREES